jgi:hypothetical protein
VKGGGASDQSEGRGGTVVLHVQQEADALVSESDSRLSHFAAVAEQDGAPLFGFCPAAIADLAAHIDAGCASLRKDA